MENLFIDFILECFEKRNIMVKNTDSQLHKKTFPHIQKNRAFYSAAEFYFF